MYFSRSGREGKSLLCLLFTLRWHSRSLNSFAFFLGGFESCFNSIANIRSVCAAVERVVRVCVALPLQWRPAPSRLNGILLRVGSPTAARLGILCVCVCLCVLEFDNHFLCDPKVLIFVSFFFEWKEKFISIAYFK